jgi:hypothetical protein
MMTVYVFHGKKFTDDDIADHFYDEDWSWFAKTLGFRPKNHADAEAQIELWKKRQSAVKGFESMRDMAELRALSKVSLERELSDKEYNRMMELGKKTGLKK